MAMANKLKFEIKMIIKRSKKCLYSYFYGIILSENINARYSFRISFRTLSLVFMFLIYLPLHNRLSLTVEHLKLFVEVVKLFVIN